ncbi:hypothetical protein DAEQUDRAFT_743461 [Daedalea quercina L-15889]|uniref:Zf-MIZ-domain-containing protein n=1 Tax=Daedalea quercina L-15889 TaxID=1314783 RepID=A0A165T2D9_9APHY|nr:hypothetical protein DAEQUDRAFT_743461 [Daedalea quercina L-15889]
MASQNVWSDFDALRHNVKSNTVERLKQILSGFNEECHTNCTKSGKKQDLIDRITREMEQWRANNNVERWVKGRTIINQVRSTGWYVPIRRNGQPNIRTLPHLRTTPTHYPPAASSSSGAIPRYDPYAPPRRPAVPPPPTPASAAPPPPNIRFKFSPFFRVERAVSAIVECPESTSSMDRKQQSLTFSMTNDVVAKLNSTSPKYQLRLYCTSSQFYSPSGFRTSKEPCPIEFPPTCEVRVNSVALSANLKGMKKKPGTAPPPDIMKNVRVQNGATNRVEMVYVNSQQPVQTKKYYLAVMLVETTTVEQLIDRLKKGKYRSSQEILEKMKQAASADDDIIADRQKMSLKCPLSYMRISTPCRSSHCVHSQCFDALSWYSLMEQTTTWMCPVCEHTLNVEDLIVDGYFDEILRSTPEDLEDVVVEADGQWHSEDNKYGSAEWKATHPESKPVQPAQSALPPPPRSPPKPVAKGVNGYGQPPPSDAEIVILDSDDEDEGRVKRELSPSNELHAAAPGAIPPSVKAADVIDLTLDSDDEDGPVPPPTKKRKVADDPVLSPTEQIWKKSRSEASSPPASVTSASASSTTWSYPTLPPRSITNGSSSTARYASSYAPNQYPGYQAPPPAPAPSPRRPPPTNQYAPRSPDWGR